MKIFYLALSLLCYCNTISSQNITVSGQCMTGAIVLSPISNINGKAAYQGTGTVAGFANTQVNIFWLTPDNLWVLAFDGQPYFQNACNTTLPWMTGNPSCPWTTVIGQPCTGGTALAISGAGALPVTLTSFTARADNQQVLVNWKTAYENNNKGFDIQRSLDGINWVSIGFIAGSLHSVTEKSYQFIDSKPVSGNSFYRLRQVDLDGKVEFSPIASVKLLKQGFYSISGNNGNNIYQLNVEATSEKVTLQLSDAGGKQLQQKAIGTGVQSIDINSYPAGIYMLQVRKGTASYTEKLIKF